MFIYYFFIIVVIIIITSTSTSTSAWGLGALATLLQCAAIDLLKAADGPGAALPAAALPLSAAQAPFRSRLRSEHCMLVRAAKLRVLEGLLEGEWCGGSLDSVSRLCGWLSDVLACDLPEVHLVDVAEAYHTARVCCKACSKLKQVLKDCFRFIETSWQCKILALQGD